MSPDFRRPAGYIMRTIHDRIIVCCGIGGHYAAGYRSTLNHCDVYEPETWQLFSHDYPDDCPNQKAMQYGFKIFAMQRAIDAGFRYIMWMDSAFQPIASLAPVWEHIAEHGYFVPRQHAATLGNWTSDAALQLFGCTRDEAMAIPLCFSGIVGLDMTCPIGRHIWARWKRYYEGGAFNGPHRNEPGVDAHEWGQKIAGHCSYDIRCQGHRHDESALSWVLYGLGQPLRSEFLTLYNPDGIIGHHVPDYDVPKMRAALLDYIGSIGDDDTSQLAALCL